MRIWNYNFRIFLIFVLFNMFIYSLSGQKKMIKKTTIFTFHYNYEKVTKDTVILERKPQIKTDTIIKEYDPKGKLIYQYPDQTTENGRLIFVDSTKIISKDKGKEHRKVFWSDSSIVDIYSEFFKDSTIIYEIKNNDTLKTDIKRYKNKRLIENLSINQNENGSFAYSTLTKYQKKTDNKEKSIILICYIKDIPSDSIKYSARKKRCVYKRYTFNPNKGVWFVEDKTIYKHRKRKEWNTFYHDYFDMYFTKSVIMKYNKSGLPDTEIKYDNYLKIIIEKTVFQYEYY